MRALRIVLALLTVLGSTVANAQTWAPLAEEFANFTLTKQETVRYGVDVRWTVKTLPAGTYPCHYGYFTDPAPGNFGKKCFIQVAEVVTPPVVPPVAAFQACYPSFTVSWPSLEIVGLTYLDVPASVESTSDRFYKFRDTCTNLITGQFSTPAERSALAMAWATGQLSSSAAANAWAKTQPVRALTVKEDAWRKAELAASNAPVVAAPVWKVSPIASGTRPYGIPNAAGTGITKKGDVAVGTLCDGAVRLNQTNYYAVPSKGAGMYALCVLVP